MRNYSLLVLLPALAGAVCLAPRASAQPTDVTRVLRTFDFEERRLGNREELPMHWAKIEGPGLPHYVNARLATDRRHGGKYSFRFDLNGGGLIYRYDAGQIKVRPGAHYRVEAFCQTTVLPNARARMTAYFTDLDGHPLRDTIRHSEAYAAKLPGEPWRKLGVELSADVPGAAFLVLELGLLQPMHYAPSSLGKRTLHTQDIRGSAWFDDVSVAQAPQISMSTERPGNLFRRGDLLRLHVQVSDPFTDDLAAQLVVRDAEGRTAYQRSGTLREASAEGAPPGSKRLALDIPDLPAGWYSAGLVISSQGQWVGEQTLNFIQLADDAADTPSDRRLRRSLPDPRFGVIATDLPFDGWEQLPEILPLLAAGRVKLAVWSAAGDVEQMDPAAFDRLLQKLQALGVTPTACLLDLPPALSEKLGGKGWPKILAARPEDWQPQLAYLISRHANHLDHWQLGADGSDLFVTQPAMRRVYARVYNEFAALTQSPDLAMPWPAWYDLDGELPATVALSVPPSVLPGQLPLYVQDLGGHKGHNLSLSLELIGRARYGRETQIRDLAQRIIYALSAGADRIDVPLPFTVQRSGEQVVQQPQEMLLILRTLMTTLSGATFQGKVPIADGVEAFLFDRDGQGIIALWDRGNVGGTREVALDLGERPVSLDLWGNVTPVLRSAADARGGQVRLALGPTPIFLVDIDGRMCRLRASVALDRPLLESSFEPHPRRLRFVNSYPGAVSGTVRLRAPAGWTLNPPAFNFSLDPGEAFDRELTIEFPYNSPGGPKTLVAEFALQADGSATFSVPVALNLGFSDVGMQTLAIRDGADVIVQQTISNYGEQPIDYNAFAVCPGQARQERLVTGLAPGKTTLKRYRFAGANPSPGTKVRVGVKQEQGTRVLNDEVEIQ